MSKNSKSTNEIIKSQRKIWTGVVVSDKNDKTIIVKVQSAKSHPIYKKKYFTSKKFAIHDGDNKYKIGQIVKFAETKPISKTKHHVVVNSEDKV